MPEVIPNTADEDIEGRFWRIAANEQRLDSASNSETARRAARLALSSYIQQPKVYDVYESLVSALVEQFDLAPHEINRVLNSSETALTSVNQDQV